MKLRDILLVNGNLDSFYNRVLQTGMDTMDEYYYSNDYLRVEKVIENGRTWHEDLIGYKEEVLINDLFINNSELEPSFEGEPNFPRELNFEDLEFE
jgi:hypothetical protein